MASPETVRDAAFVASIWDVQDGEVRQLAEQNRLEALEGFGAALRVKEYRVSALALCLDLYSVDELRGAEAADWMWFGPPLDKDLTPRQWAEMACSGILFHDQTEWLKRKATAESKLELARACAAEDSRVWHQALQATPAPLPDELVDAIVAN